MTQVWEQMLEAAFRAGETFCIASDISKEDAIAYWFWPNNSSCRVFVAEISVEGGELSSDATADGLDKIVGSFSIFPAQRGNGAHVASCSLIIAPKAQNLGVDRAMLAHAMQAALEAKYTAMQFDFVVSTDVAALALYEAAGIDQVGKIPGAFEHPSDGFVDALILHKALDEAFVTKWTEEVRASDSTLLEPLIAPPPAAPAPAPSPAAEGASQASEGAAGAPAAAPATTSDTAPAPSDASAAVEPSKPAEQAKQKPKSAFHPPVLDPETGYDTNDPLHFLDSIAFKLDQILTPRDDSAVVSTPMPVNGPNAADTTSGSLTARPAPQVVTSKSPRNAKSPGPSRPSTPKKKGRK